MSDTQPPAYALDDDVLERAAEAMYRSHPLIAKSGADEWDNLTEANRDNWTGMVRAALPVIGPALRAEALRPLSEWYRNYIRLNYPDEMNQTEWLKGDRPHGIMIPVSLIESILDDFPAADEREQEDAR